MWSSGSPARTGSESPRARSDPAPPARVSVQFRSSRVVVAVVVVVVVVADVDVVGSLVVGY